MYCEFCGKAIPDKALSCPECGYPVSQIQPNNQPSVQPQQEETTSLDQTQIHPQYPPNGQTQPAQPAQIPPEQPPSYQYQAQPGQSYQAPPQFQYQGQPNQQYQQAYPYQPAMQYQPQYTMTQQKPKKKKTGLIIGLCCGGGVIILAAIAVAILWFTGFFGGHEVSSVSIANSPNQVAIEFSTALLEGDGQAFIDLMPDPVVSDVIEDSGFSDETEMASYLENYLSTSINYITAMGGTLDFTVEDSTPVSDSDLAEIQDLYSKYNLTVIAAEDVPVTFTIKLSGSEDVTDDETIPVIQIGQTWYLDYCRWDTD